MRTTLTNLRALYAKGEKIAVLTCYSASLAALLEENSVDILLVGDSLGMVVQGHETTLPVTLGDMIYHTRCVARGAQQAFIMVDMPFGTSQISPEKTFEQAAKLLAAGAQMVKLEGGEIMAETIFFLAQRGIPVCAHIGLTPQSVHQLGGYKVQGKTDAAADLLRADALTLQTAGASILVLEAIPAALGKEAPATEMEIRASGDARRQLARFRGANDVDGFVGERLRCPRIKADDLVMKRLGVLVHRGEQRCGQIQVGHVDLQLGVIDWL